MQYQLFIPKDQQLDIWEKELKNWNPDSRSAGSKKFKIYKNANSKIDKLISEKLN